jgi:hypothetical protein
MAQLPVPSKTPKPPVEGIDMNDPVEVALSGVNGKVRNAIVKKIRTMVDQDPKQFVNGLRQLLYQGGERD